MIQNIGVLLITSKFKALNDAKQPDGVTLFAWSGGKHVVWDYTCHDTLCQSYVGGTSKEAGKAAEDAEKAKSTKYRELDARFEVIPVANETFGSWGAASLKFVREIGETMIQYKPKTKGQNITSFNDSAEG